MNGRKRTTVDYYENEWALHMRTLKRDRQLHYRINTEFLMQLKHPDLVQTILWKSIWESSENQDLWGPSKIMQLTVISRSTSFSQVHIKHTHTLWFSICGVCSNQSGCAHRLQDKQQRVMWQPHAGLAQDLLMPEEGCQMLSSLPDHVPDLLHMAFCSSHPPICTLLLFTFPLSLCPLFFFPIQRVEASGETEMGSLLPLNNMLSGMTTLLS